MCSVGKNFAFALLAIFCPLVTMAQLTIFRSQFDESTYTKAINLLESKINVASDFENQYDLGDVNQIFHNNYSNTDSLQAMWFENQKALIKKDLGLNAVGSFGMNEQFVENNGETSFGMRMRAGLEWNILENGLGSRNKKLRQLEKEQNIYNLESKLDQKEHDYPHSYNNLIYAFNKQKILLLNQRIWFLQDFIAVLYELYHNHDLSYTELIDHKTKLEESKVLRQAFERFNKAFEQAMGDDLVEINVNQLPLVEIDLELLLSDTTFQNLQEELAVAKKELIELKNDATNRVNLRLAAHYNYRSNTLNNTNPSFSSTVRMPLRFDKAERKRAAEIEMEMLDEDVNYVYYNNARELMNLFQEYNYKLKQYIEFRHKTARLNEQERLEQVLLRDERLAHSPMKALLLKETHIAVQLELLDIKQQLYIRLLKMYSKTYHSNFTECLTPINLKKIDRKLPGERFVFLSEHDLGNMDSNFLIAYLKKNEFKNLFLPLSIASDKILVEKFKAEGFLVFTEDFIPQSGSFSIKDQFDGFYLTGYEGNDKFFYIPEKYITNDHFTTRVLKIHNVPVNTFYNRVELENWLLNEAENQSSPYFLVQNINRLVQLEKQNLALTEEN